MNPLPQTGGPAARLSKRVRATFTSRFCDDAATSVAFFTIHKVTPYAAIRTF